MLRTNARLVGDLATEATAHDELACALMDSGETTTAGNHAAQSLACYRQLGDGRGTADALATVALVHHLEGHNEPALSAISHAREALRETPDRRVEGTLEEVAGVVYFNQGQLERASVSFERRLIAHRSTGQRRGEGAMLARLAYVALIEGRFADADRGAQEALLIHREVRDQILEGYSLGTAGRAQYALGMEAAGRALLATAVDRLRAAGVAGLLGRTLCHLAALLRVVDPSRAAARVAAAAAAGFGANSDLGRLLARSEKAPAPAAPIPAIGT